MRLSSLADRVVLITGVASGIGKSLLKQLWRSDAIVVGTAREHSLRTLSPLEFPPHKRALLLPLDVTSPREREEAIAKVRKSFGGVDILINNAGVAYSSVIEDLTEPELIEQLKVNTLGPLELIRLVLPHMRAQRWGKIINVSSVGGMMAMPTMGPYSASKFALEGASEALWYELRPWNIGVSIIEPGFVNSDGFRHTRLTERAHYAQMNPTPYSKYYQHMSCFIEKMMKKSFSDSESIATRIIEVAASEHAPLRVPVTADAYIFGYLRRFLPRKLYHAILYHSLPGIREWTRKNAPRIVSAPRPEEGPPLTEKVWIGKGD